MAKSYVNLDTRIDSFTSEFNNLVNKVGDIAVMSTSGTDSGSNSNAGSMIVNIFLSTIVSPAIIY